MATYAIGDVQGCFASLERLLERIEYRPSVDRLWLTGDLVNRGPRSLDVLRWAIAQGDSVTSVLGNHDLHFLTRAIGQGKAKRRDTLADALAAPDVGELVDWLRHRPLVHREGDRLLVHAGFHPTWDLAEAEGLARAAEAGLRGDGWEALVASWDGTWPEWQPDLVGRDRVAAGVGVMTHVRMLDRAGQLDRGFKRAPDQAPPGHVPWFAHPERRIDLEVVCGHWAALGLRLEPRLVAVDTGCVWGEALTAVRLDDRAVFAQPAVELAPG